MQQPKPRCTALVVCGRVVKRRNGEICLKHLAQGLISGFYPVAQQLGVFARLTAARADCTLEVQLLTMDGETVWRGGPAQMRPVPELGGVYDLQLNVMVVFPKPGRYHIVLLANAAEIGRQSFVAEFDPETCGHAPRAEVVQVYDDSKVRLETTRGPTAKEVSSACANSPDADQPIIVDYVRNHP